MLSTLKLDCFGLQISFSFFWKGGLGGGGGGGLSSGKQLLIVLRCDVLLWYPV